MKKFMALTMIAFILGLSLMPKEIFAYSGGLLQGKPMNVSNSLNWDVLRTTNVLTDGDENGYFVLDQKDSNPTYSNKVWYQFSSPKALESLKYKIEDDVYLRLYDVNGTLLKEFYIPITPLKDQPRVLNFPEPVANVSKVSFEIEYTYKAIALYEVDVFEAKDVVAPYAPTITNVVTGSGTAYVEWSEVIADDLAGYHVYVNGARITTGYLTGTSYTINGLSNNVNNVITVKAIDLMGNESVASNAVTSIFDTISPLAPIGLVSYPLPGGKAHLEWTPNSEPDLAGYNVYQDAVKKNTALVLDPEFLVTGLLDNVTYSFTVTAEDLSKNESPHSKSVTYYIDSDAPEPPSNVTGTVQFDRADITWTASPSSDVVGYNLYVNGLKKNIQLITGYSYAVTGLAEKTNYNFTVRAVDDTGNESVNSNVFAAKTPAEPMLPPVAPSQLSVTSMNESLSVSWSAVGNATSYNIYVNGVKYNAVPIGSTAFVVTGLTNGTSYNIQVSAVNGVGESSLSLAKAGIPSDKALPYIKYTYNLGNIADAVGNWFTSYWLILVFALSIPLSFAVGHRVKSLFD